METAATQPTGQGTKKKGMLTNEQIRRIDAAGLRILEEAGIVLQDDSLLTILAQRGCRTVGERAWLPHQLVEEILALVPPALTLYSRDTRIALTLDGESRTASNSGVDPRIYDLESGELRLTTIQDVADTTRVLDALPRVGLLAATLVEPTDVAPAMTIVKGFEITLRNTTKPIIGPGLTNEAEARAALAIGVALRGSQAALTERPFFVPWFCPVSPLTYRSDLLAALRVCAEAGLPLALVTDPVAGLTGPLTLAGVLAQMHAELLAAIVLAQMMRPGLPVLYQGTASAVDLRKMLAINGAPETGLIKQAGVLLGRHRGLPTTGFGLTSMSKMVDVEYGYEKAANGLACAEARPSVLSAIGHFSGATYASYESLVIDHELVGFLWRLLDGLNVDEDTLAVQTVVEAMGGEDFIAHRHTLAHLRDGEYWSSILSDSLSLDEWTEAGRPGALSRAREVVKTILAGHTVPELPPQADSRLRRAMADAERDLLGQH